MKKYIINLILILGLNTNSIAQELKKDTLYFKFKTNYLIEGKIEKNHYYIKEISNQGAFYFKKINTLNELKPKTTLCLKKYIHTSKYFDPEKKITYDSELATSLNNHIIFLVKKVNRKLTFIQVSANFEIE